MPISQEAYDSCQARPSNTGACIRKFTRLCDHVCPELPLERCARLCAADCQWHCQQGGQVMASDLFIPGMQCVQTCAGAAKEEEEDPPPRSEVARRKTIPLMVHRNPRRLFNFQPIQGFMYGEITGMGPVDSRWRNAGM